MTPFKRRLLDHSLAGLLLLLPLVMLHAGLKDKDRLSGFDRAVLRISSPLEAAASWVIGGLGGLWNRYVWLVDVEDENQELRADNLRLHRELAQARRAAADTQALEDLVRLRRRTQSETVGARVISSSINPFLRVVRVRLDRGEGEVQVGMPVIDEHGLVGLISRVYGRYSDVMLVTNSQSQIDVTVPRTGGRGWLIGLGSGDVYRCKIDVLERGKPVQIGDQVVTSGLGALPAGIPVGNISRVNTVEYKMYQGVEVNPVVDFGSLSRVLVVLAPPPAPDPDGDQPAPARPAAKVGAY